MTELSRASVDILAQLFSYGFARIPEAWDLTGPRECGFWRRATEQETAATPLLLRCARTAANDGERVGILLATESRFRDSWLTIAAARLADLGGRNRLEELCRQIDILGASTSSLRARVQTAAIKPTPHAALEHALFGAPADQAAAAPVLVRVLGATAALIEGGSGSACKPLQPVHPRDPSGNWVAGRLIQAPGVQASGSGAVLRGSVPGCSIPNDRKSRMSWVLETPWLTFLTVVVFTAEAWAAERMGGLKLELPGPLIQQYTRPPTIMVVITLDDGREVSCGTLGELCLRVIDSLGMAIVPAINAGDMDRRLSTLITELLSSGVWRYRPEERPCYVIGEEFGFDCYRGEGHRYIFLGAEELSNHIRGVAVAWARSRIERAERKAIS